ncbi:hypothetical protein V2E29_01205 [Streptomyces diastatochromogenes]|uniref:hypothetical protein n=1 Tax=Streptomyces diastatochromogenes TaxID=42236 RepID=UPI002F26253A
MLVVEEITQGAGEVQLYRELYAGTPMEMPELTGKQWPAPAGVLAARQDGELLGWVVYFSSGHPGDTAILQWIMVRQERERLTTGYNPTSPATTADIDALAALAAKAARHARRAGYTEMQWSPTEPGLAEGITTRLNARTVKDEDGFYSYRLAL